MTAIDSRAIVDEIRALSEQKFGWAADSEIDRFAELLDDTLAFVHLTGMISSKGDWIAELRAGAYGYREMQFADCDVHDHGGTVVLIGRSTSWSPPGRRAGSRSPRSTSRRTEAGSSSARTRAPRVQRPRRR
jgi:Domain of unknown function (DUF4440)